MRLASALKRPPEVDLLLAHLASRPQLPQSTRQLAKLPHARYLKHLASLSRTIAPRPGPFARIETNARLVLCDSGGSGRSAGVSAFIDRSGYIRYFQVGGGSFIVHASLDRFSGGSPRTALQRLTEVGVTVVLLLAWAVVAVAESEAKREADDESRLGRLAACARRAALKRLRAARERLTGGGSGALLM